ncbi:putative translation initiation factor 3 complex subunit L [Helianthus annuus]|nr:putative translation initiation factor 3 complex subunit L [Helianthus annuus]KAJ0736548.1 putative translation initiation factor 3 complex subunit L [Helianthus annuus]KAJ0739494.1 putative translation initiation factor 3 complex subunit L [Helianthus annuus]
MAAMDMDVVKELHRSINEGDENKMCTLYRELMTSDCLPSLEEVDQAVGNNFFYTLYAEIWYRHPGSSSIPTFPQRLASWHNYRCLFEDVIPILSDSRFPYQWLWDMVDEFVNQFQSFSELRAKDPTKLKEYYEVRQAGIIMHMCVVILMFYFGQDWSVHYVLLLLERLAELFPKLEEKDVAGEPMRAASAAAGGCCDSEHVSIAMGYFSKVALLRVHCLLGNYQTGLDCMRPMDITQRRFYTRHIATHITTIYHYGFANFMSGSYVEAIREFNEILKTEQQQQPQQKEQRMLDKMRDLLAVCLSLCPEVQLELVDERLGYQLMKNHGENIIRMQSCDDADAKAVFKELLSHAWPRFTTSFAPSSGDPREFFSMEELEELVPEGEDGEFLAIVFPHFFGPSAPSYVSPLANYEEVQIFCSNESVWLIWLLFSKKMGPFLF